MAITKNAKKAIRSHARKRVFNVRRKVSLHGAVKTLKTTIASGNTGDAQTQLSRAYQELDKAAKRGIIKKNTAARKKSRLTKALARTQK